MTGLTILERISDLVGKSAPILGTVLGSPLAGVGISLLSNVFGVDPKQTDKLLDAISGDPDAAIKLQTLEFQHREALLEIESKFYATEVDDRKSARDMESKTSSYIPHVLAIAFLFIYIIIQICAINNPGNQDDIISARVQDIMVMIISFYFGSSHREIKPQ